jgi:hypothetical protein
MTKWIKYIPVNYISESHFQEYDSEGAFGNPPVRSLQSTFKFRQAVLSSKTFRRGDDATVSTILQAERMFDHKHFIC